MDTLVRAVRRGLPRVAGGPAWPDIDAPEPAPRALGTDLMPDGGASPSSEASLSGSASPLGDGAGPASGSGAGSDAGDHGATLTGAHPGEIPVAATQAAQAFARRGLPRVAGGEPWPAEGTEVPERWCRAATASATSAATVSPADAPAGLHTAGAVAGTDAAAASTAASLTGAHPGEIPVAATQAARAFARRGLPRVAGGEPWPVEGTAVPERWRRVAHESLATVASSAVPDSVVEPPTSVPQVEAPATSTTSTARPVPPPSPAPATRAPAAAAPSRTAAPQPGTAPSGATKPAPTRGKAADAAEPSVVGRWIKRGALGLLALLAAAGLLVLAARGLTTFQPVRDFLERYPGEYHLPASAPVGMPGWMGWQHFFNMFLMVLIVRSGLQVRHQKKPPAFFTPKGGGKKVSLNLWLHQSLDVLWLVNGLVFVVLLFATGQWMRVIPTSWEVFPNALSAALQYATLEWPAENGWVNYNSLQQLAYGLTVFVAAPLAALSGWRMSALWPAKATGLTRVYKVEWARAVHFPVMLYFVAFVLVHVILVLSTGALRNLNHMYASNDGHGWLGFATFAGSLLVIAGAWFAARPMLLAPLASKFGSVSSR